LLITKEMSDLWGPEVWEIMDKLIQENTDSSGKIVPPIDTISSDLIFDNEITKHQSDKDISKIHKIHKTSKLDK